jgi:hypothetical protein
MCVGVASVRSVYTFFWYLQVFVASSAVVSLSCFPRSVVLPTSCSSSFFLLIIPLYSFCFLPPIFIIIILLSISLLLTPSISHSDSCFPPYPRLVPFQADSFPHVYEFVPFDAQSILPAPGVGIALVKEVFILSTPFGSLLLSILSFCLSITLSLSISLSLSLIATIDEPDGRRRRRSRQQRVRSQWAPLKCLHVWRVIFAVRPSW